MQASQQLNSNRSLSSELIKLRFCDPYRAATDQEWIKYRNRHGRKIICQWCVVELVMNLNGILCAHPGTAASEKTTLVQACFMAEY